MTLVLLGRHCEPVGRGNLLALSCSFVLRFYDLGEIAASLRSSQRRLFCRVRNDVGFCWRFVGTVKSELLQLLAAQITQQAGNQSDK